MGRTAGYAGAEAVRVVDRYTRLMKVLLAFCPILTGAIQIRRLISEIWVRFSRKMSLFQLAALYTLLYNNWLSTFSTRINPDQTCRPDLRDKRDYSSSSGSHVPSRKFVSEVR